MLPEKESLVFFERLASRQVRVFNDACDVGVKLDASTKSLARRALLSLKECYDGKVRRHGRSLENSTTEIFVPYEQEGDLYLGVLLEVTYTVVQRRFREEWLGVSIRRYSKRITQEVAA